MAIVFALSSKLSLATITFADVQNCSTIEISTGKEVESFRDLSKTLSYIVFLPIFFFSKLCFNYTVQGGVLSIILQRPHHVTPRSATGNGAVFICLIKTLFLQLYMYSLPQL